jgi:hypothetical protein
MTAAGASWARWQKPCLRPLMQYHPDARWLKEHGYSEQLTKCVHIPEVADFLKPEGIHSQPWVVLRELAHGFHDQMIGFDDPRVTAA